MDSKHIISLLIILLLCVSCFFIGRRTGERNISENIVTKSDTITLIRTDTITHERIVPKTVYIDRIVKDTLYSVDSVLVPIQIPISKYIFKDSLYKAEISGYKVSLDKMDIYSKTREIMIINTVKVPIPKRWGLGLSAGYSYTPIGFQPYIGVGVNYNIITF